MKSSSDPTTTNYQPVTVEVPEDRIAEFHAFFARFLAGRSGRRRGHHRGAHRGLHGRHCAERREPSEGTEATEGPAETTEV